MSYNRRDRRAPSKKTEVETDDSENRGFSISFEQPSTPDVGAAATTSGKMEDHLPPYASPEWQKYVLGLLNPEELYDGYPKCFGLRRLAHHLLGPIVEQGVSNLSVIPIVTAEEKNSRAVTVVYDVYIDWKLSTNVPLVVGYELNGVVPVYNRRKFSGTADCVEDMNSPYGRHPAATAETKAESRALKRALGINVITAEEKVSGYDDRESLENRKDISESKISDQLKNFISAKLSKLDRDVDSTVSEYLKSIGAVPKNISEFTMSQGQEFFAYINGLQQGR